MSTPAAVEIDLRRGIDHIGVTCVFFCHDGKGNVLLHKRSERCRDEQGKWDCGAGSMEFGETFEEAVTREIQEEYGVRPLELRYVATNNVVRKNGVSSTHWIALIFAALVDPAGVKIGEPEKMSELGWYPHDQIPSPAHSMLLEHLNMVRQSGDEFQIFADGDTPDRR